MAVGARFSHGAAALPPLLPCWGPVWPAKLRHLQAARAGAAEPISTSTAMSPIQLLPGEVFWWKDSCAPSRPCCAGTTLLYKLTNKLNQLNCFKFSLFKWAFAVVWVSIALNLNLLIVLLRMYFALSCCWSSYLIYLANVFWLTLRCPLLQEASLVQVLPQLFSRKKARVFLVIRVPLHWCSGSLVFFFPYLCLYYVTIQGVPALVLCFYGAQKMIALWTCGLRVAQKPPVRVARDCYKDLNVVFCSPKWNSCCRSSFMLK